ncbi:MAG: PKD domain-containing protein, partial [Candidatus Latescibacteria bacterium]|nr:PKD domain-containing protein [Candidatus Latescibacterota bacterium]
MAGTVDALERPDVEFKIFQFPADMIPRIDGNTSDWDIVPDGYAIGQDQLMDTVRNSPQNRKDLDVTVTVGWVKGLNRLYFLYEGYDDYWDFKHPDLHNDIFEIVVDGDLSGGALIPQMREDSETNRVSSDPWKGYLYHGVQAQNYHVFTPAEGKAWTMVWGCNPWLLELPWSNVAYSYDFKPGESGRLILECWITPFDYAPYEGPERAVASKLEEDGIIGLSWSILDYDDENAKTQQYDGFWNLSHKTEMYGNASDLVAFRLMPLETRFRDPVEADWTFKIVDMDRRLVAFKDRSYGNITTWLWDFGDGTTSTEQNPMHRYEKPGLMNVVV